MEVFNREFSKIKMVILTKHGFENTAWYSPMKQNRWNSQRIITGMIARFKRNRLAPFTNTLQFFENGIKIHTEKL